MIQLEAEEIALVDRAAQAAGSSRSAWVRSIVLASLDNGTSRAPTLPGLVGDHHGHQKRRGPSGILRCLDCDQVLR